MSFEKKVDLAVIADDAYVVLSEMHRNWTIDELLLHPKQAIELCQVVRSRAGRKVTDQTILRSLINARKQSKLPPRPARRAG